MSRNATKLTLGGIVGAGALLLSPFGGILPAHALPSTSIAAKATGSGYGNNGLARIGGLPDEANVTAVAAGKGRLIALSTTSGAQEIALRMLGATGNPVTGFGTNGVLTLGTGAADAGRDLAWSRADDRVYVLADSGSAATVWAVDADGKVDTSFGGGGSVAIAGADAQRLAVDDAGRVVVAGANGAGAAAWRLTRTGTPDASFGSAGVYTGPAGASYDSVATTLYNEVYLGHGDGTDAKVTRLGAGGAPVASFGTGGTATVSGTGAVNRVEVVLQNVHRESGPLPVVVAARDDGGSTVTRVDRLTAAGAVDGAFTGSAAQGLRDPGRPTALVDDHQLVLPGATASGDPRLVQLAFDGKPSGDLPGGSWTDNRVAGAATAVSLQPDGTYLASGQPASGNAFVHAVTGTAVPQCDGTYATIVGAAGEAIVGTSYADVISLTGADDKARARGGDDLVCGKGGNDKIKGGAGNDRLRGGAGDDTLVGGGGDDVLIGGSGDDTIRGGKGKDRIKAGPGNDTATGGAGRDLISGGKGNDTLRGAKGNDTLWGRTGDDVLRGGAGDDVLRGGKGDDVLYGGKGRDLLFGGSGNDRLHQ